MVRFHLFADKPEFWIRALRKVAVPPPEKGYQSLQTAPRTDFHGGKGILWGRLNQATPLILEAPPPPMAKAGKPQQQATAGFPFLLFPLPIRLDKAPSQRKGSFPSVPVSRIRVDKGFKPFWLYGLTQKSTGMARTNPCPSG